MRAAIIMPRMRIARLWLLALPLLACAQPKPSVIQELTTREAKLEQLYAEYWRAEYKNALGDKNSSSIPVQKQIRELVTDKQFLERLDAARFKDPLLQRRRKLFLDEAAHTFIFTDERLAKLVEDMGNDEAEIKYKVGDKELRRSDLNNLIGKEPDREQRRLAWYSRGQNHAVTGEPIREAMKLRKELGQKYAKRNFVDFMLERKGVPERVRLIDIFNRFLKETDADYQQLLARIRRDLKIDKVEPWDIEYFFSTLTGDFETKKFPRDEAWPRIKRVSAELGYDFDKLPVDTVITELTFGGGTYPILYTKEVRILINKYEGIRFTDTLFHEAGHALHYSLMEDPTFILRGSSSEPFDEGCGQIMALLLYRPQVAMKHFGLTGEEVKAINERYRLRSIVDTRETIAEAMFEYAAYASPEQDFAKLYNTIYGNLMGIEMHGVPVWAFNPFFSTGPIYIQSYAVAEMFARQVHADAQRRFGDTWGKPAGDYLRKNYFSISGRMTLDEVLKRGTGEALNPKYLIDYAKGNYAAK
jgi:oligoendopeptidase F